MTTAGLVLLVSLLVFMVMGIPIAFSLGLASTLSLLVSGNVPLLVVPQRIHAAIDSFPMMAIIFFIMTGELMLQGGLSRRLVNAATALLGRVRGSMAYISIATATFFGAISGSAMATTAAIGGIMYPEMVKDGDYEPTFSATLQAVGGTLGALIPPSIPVILYGITTNNSIASLFMAIVIPGLFMALTYSVASYLIMRKKGMGKSARKSDIKVGKALLDGFWALLSPVIILGGIYGGVFTPTEAAIVASVYSLIIGMFVYRELTPKAIYKALVNTGITSAAIMFLTASASLFGWVMTTQNIPQLAAAMMMNIVHSKTGFLLLVNVLLLIAGMFMESSTIILLTMPLLYPVSQIFGVNPIHFGIIVVVNITIGLFTPPFGCNLFVAASTCDQKIEPLMKQSIPFIIAGVIGLLILTFVPWFSSVLI
ncbi:MAG: TRAP transporter large permease [Anaerolineaceae bacterium]|nr:TRAP transporter large permease [Anaerolineaceae bacterium]